MKLGRNRPKTWRPTLALERYLSPSIEPARPLGARWESKAIHALHDPLGNDRYGDCVFAAMLKQNIAWRRDAGDTTSPDPTEADALGLYSKVTGFNRSDPSTDMGGDLQTAMAYVKAHGAYPDGSGKIEGWVSVDATRPASVMAAIDAFGGVYTGSDLPDAWLDGAHEGSVWRVAGEPNPANGHCTAWFDYDAAGVIINTWGLFVLVTWGAVRKYWAAGIGGEAYAVLGEDWMIKASGRAPSGLDLAQLEADLAASA